LRLSLENRTDRRIIPALWIAGDRLHDLLGKRKPFLTAKRLLTNQTLCGFGRTLSSMSKKNIKTPVAAKVARLCPGTKPPAKGGGLAGKRGPGRPPGMPNKISRTMKEAVLGAVELLGSTDLDQWGEVIKLAETDPDPYRRYFTVVAVQDQKSFMTVIGRMIPSHVIHSKAQRYMTVEAAKQELREAGIPEDVVDDMPYLDIDDVDPDEIEGNRKSPYDDPEEDMLDVTPPKAEAAE
jgi:Family of unknown function (DUF5939)